MIANFLNDGVISPIWVVSSYVYSVGFGGALCVFSIEVEMLNISVSNKVQVICHCSNVSW